MIFGHAKEFLHAFADLRRSSLAHGMVGARLIRIFRLLYDLVGTAASHGPTHAWASVPMETRVCKAPRVNAY